MPSLGERYTTGRVSHGILPRYCSSVGAQSRDHRRGAIIKSFDLLLWAECGPLSTIWNLAPSALKSWRSRVSQGACSRFGRWGY